MITPRRVKFPFATAIVLLSGGTSSFGIDQVLTRPVLGIPFGRYGSKPPPLKHLERPNHPLDPLPADL